MLMPKERSGLYNNHTKVILEMAESYNVFSRCIYFNPEMTEKYQNNTDRYIKYYTNIVRQIDIYLQEDQLMHTKQGFPLVPAPSYLPNMYELEHSDVRQIDDRASTEIRRVENEMLVIMQEHQEWEQQDVSHNSFHSSFSRIRSEELNNMGVLLKQDQSPSSLMMMHSRHQIIGPRIEHQHQHLERGKMRPMIDLPHRHHNRMVTTNHTMQMLA